MSSQAFDEPLLGSNGQPTATIRHGNTILRPAGPWTPTVHSLLRHLEQVGLFRLASGRGRRLPRPGPRDPELHRGKIAHPHPYTDEGIRQVGELLGALHDATASFQPPPGAEWQPWSLRSDAPRCSHQPRRRRPLARHPAPGPTDRVHRLVAGRPDRPARGAGGQRLVERPARLRRRPRPGQRPARSCRPSWEATAPVPGRLRPPSRTAAGLVTRMIEFAIRDGAGLAEIKQITPESNDPTTLWILAWQTRAAAWMLRHRPMLERAMLS
jgi:hypothetical protein